jgi:hypothetical protein
MVFFIKSKGFGKLRIEDDHQWNSGKIKLEGCDVFLEVGLGIWYPKIEEINPIC